MYKKYPCPYCFNTPMHTMRNMYNTCEMYPCPYCFNPPMYNLDFSEQFTNRYIPFTDEMNHYLNFNFSQSIKNDDLNRLKDYGPEPFVINIEEATKQNNTYRTALWTGENLQVTLMSINVGEDIGLEIHPDVDQFIRIEEGEGIVKMGDRKNMLDYQKNIYDNFAIMIPAGKWHNIINTGNTPLKLYSIYAPPHHPHGTVHKTKAMAQAAEESSSQ